jgi:hypothetical protein
MTLATYQRFRKVRADKFHQRCLLTQHTGHLRRRDRREFHSRIREALSPVILQTYLLRRSKVSSSCKYTPILCGSMDNKCFPRMFPYQSTRPMTNLYFRQGFLCGSRGVSSFWTTPPQDDLTEYTIDFGAFQNAIAGIDLALDVMILSLPIPVIKQLHMTGDRKVSLAAVFMLGALYVLDST